MPAEQIPPDLRDFLLRHIDSVAQLEALVLLDASPADRWTAAKLAARLYISEEQALQLLMGLKEDGFVESGQDNFHYTGGTAEERKTIRQLIDYYSSHIVLVSHLIHSKPRRIREFAKAFRLKREH